MGQCELEARALGNDPVALFERLAETVSVLRDDLRKAFGRGERFDFEAKRLYPAHGRFYLQWRVRLDPDAPESYENQQTNCGVVTYETLPVE